MTLHADILLHARPLRRPATPWLVFAALVLAWICANHPQPLAYAIADWVKQAATFSHHDRLVQDVRALLATTPADDTVTSTAVSAPPNETAAPTAPSSSENCVHRRPEWSLCETLSVPPPDLTAFRFSTDETRPPGRVAADVPHPPPRFTAYA